MTHSPLRRRIPRRLLQMVGLVIGLPAAAMALILAVWSVGAISALGVQDAWRLAIRAQALEALKGVGMMALFSTAAFAALEVGELGFAALSRRSKRVSHLVAMSLLAITTVGITGALLVFAQGKARELASKQATETVAELAAKQNAALVGASESARALLNNLEETDTELQATKERVRATLAALSVQRRAAEQSIAIVSETQQREARIAEQIAALRTALDGRMPVTKDDMDRSWWRDQAWGIGLGFLINVLAAGAYDFFGFRRISNALGGWRVVRRLRGSRLSEGE